MNILVIGGGGREHAIVKALKRSPRVQSLWCAPGNAGIAQEATCVPIPAENLRELIDFAETRSIDLVVIGPEAPLVMGLADHFRRANVKVVGPSAQAAQLEGSKSFAKQFMRKYGIPTARYEVIPNLTKGAYQLSHWPGRSVVKADGLAAGKGVKVCETPVEAKEFLYQLMEKEIFGAAGSTAIIEECLQGEEATLMAFCDGQTLVPMPASQDHKRLEDGDRGPNTGGMGAYAPAPLITAERMAVIQETICKPFLAGIQAERFDFQGVIYFGLMVTACGPKVLEFNVRFGDPETQVVLPLLDTDIVEIFEAVADRRLGQIPIRWKAQSSLCVVVASAGYPGSYAKGKVVSGLDRAAKVATVYHAGTAQQGRDVVTSGGRVFGVTGIGDTLESASQKAYGALSEIQFDGMMYRRDIGARAIPVVGRQS
ncbi:MAG TPA: phosphoribosylamine--glycine ligase [Elusimicrobiota bacterium]|nr:phosphoribosylamine--glycine ligase [Elusimicrobiota bacterium]